MNPHKKYMVVVTYNGGRKRGQKEFFGPYKNIEEARTVASSMWAFARLQGMDISATVAPWPAVDRRLL